MAISHGNHVRITLSEWEDLYRQAAAFGLEQFVPESVRTRAEFELACAAARGTWALWELFEALDQRFDAGAAGDLATELVGEELFLGHRLSVPSPSD